MRFTLIELLIALAFLAQAFPDLVKVAFPVPPEQTKTAPEPTSDEIQSDWK